MTDQVVFRCYFYKNFTLLIELRESYVFKWLPRRRNFPFNCGLTAAVSLDWWQSVFSRDYEEGLYGLKGPSSPLGHTTLSRLLLYTTDTVCLRND